MLKTRIIIRLNKRLSPLRNNKGEAVRIAQQVNEPLRKSACQGSSPGISRTVYKDKQFYKTVHSPQQNSENKLRINESIKRRKTTIQLLSFIEADFLSVAPAYLELCLLLNSSP